ncbi:MAG TPA: hypothetical protein VNA25_21820, partial [Phycisphaerae bacterium]|nr:hypothetical protein [Phycisphaerae bacterium]
MSRLGAGQLGAPLLGGGIKPFRPGGKENRRRPRITIEELNTRGIEAIREKWPELAQAKRGLSESVEKRTALEKFFDWIDLPRNAVANVIGSLVGVEKQKLPRAALGMRRVWAGEILKKLGLQTGNKVADAVINFFADVAIDPLTYYSAGALTGKAVARYAPRLLKPAVASLKNVARLGEKAAAGPLKTAIRGLDLTKMNWRQVGAAIAERAAKLGDEIGDAARAFFKTPGYSVTGRWLSRIPL